MVDVGNLTRDASGTDGIRGALETREALKGLAACRRLVKMLLSLVLRPLGDGPVWG